MQWLVLLVLVAVCFFAYFFLDLLRQLRDTDIIVASQKRSWTPITNLQLPEDADPTSVCETAAAALEEETGNSWVATQVWKLDQGEERNLQVFVPSSVLVCSGLVEYVDQNNKKDGPGILWKGKGTYRSKTNGAFVVALTPLELFLETVDLIPPKV